MREACLSRYIYGALADRGLSHSSLLCDSRLVMARTCGAGSGVTSQSQWIADILTAPQPAFPGLSWHPTCWSPKREGMWAHEAGSRLKCEIYSIASYFLFA